VLTNLIFVSNLQGAFGSADREPNFSANLLELLTNKLSALSEFLLASFSYKVKKKIFRYIKH